MPSRRAVDRIAVLGLGLIGGSLALRLASHHEVVCYDRDPAALRAAAESGLRVADTIPAAVAGRQLIVVAVPTPALLDVLARVTAAADAGAVITDVSSVKVPALAAWRAAAGDRAGTVRYVGGHPMAGTELTGFAAADPQLFRGASWALCLEDDTDLAAWLRLTQLLVGIGSRVVPTRAAGHDAAVARVSGLPHLLALVLARVAAAGGPLALSLAAGSFRDGTRVAAANPELVAVLTDGNRDALLAATDEALQELKSMRDMLATGGSQLAAAREGRADRQRWSTQFETRTELVLTASDPDATEALLRLGAAGGRVVEVDGPKLLCILPGL